MKVAILGTIPYSKMMAPFGDNEWEIWCCSPGNRGGVIPRVTRWFELHGIDDCKGAENADWNKDYFDWLNKQSFPVYMQEPNDLVAEALIFPQKAWLTEFGDWGRMAATSSISLMIGYAIMMKAETIAIFGVDMQADEEQYTLQKSGCHIMIQLAKERGISVQIPLESCLATMPPFYGYDMATRMGRRLFVRKMELENQLKHAQSQLEHWLRVKENVTGQIQQVHYVLRTFVDGVDDVVLDVEEHVARTPEGLTSTFTPKGMTVGWEDEAAASMKGVKEFPDHRPVVIPGDISPGAKDDGFIDAGGGLLVPKSHLAKAAEAAE